MTNKIYNHLEEIDSSKIKSASLGKKTKRMLDSRGFKEPKTVGWYSPNGDPRIKIGIPENVTNMDAWKNKMDVKYKVNLKV